MARSLTDVAGEFIVSLARAELEAMLFWSFASAQRIQFTLRSGFRPDGTRMPPLKASTLRIKAAQGYDLRVGIRTGKLMLGIQNAIHPVTHPPDSHFQVLGSDGIGDNDRKAILLINGRGNDQVIEKVSRGKRYKQRVRARQVRRDYVGHDEKVVDKACDRVIDEVLKAWRFA